MLFRARPTGGGWARVAFAGGAFVVGLAIALIAAGPTAARVRRLAEAARASAREEYATMAPIAGRDEIASMGAVFNEAAADIRRRMVDSADREEALQRHVTMTSEEVAAPLADVVSSLGTAHDTAGLPPAARAALRESLRNVHQLAGRLASLTAATRLRAGERLSRERVDLGAIAREVVDERQALARASEVTLVFTPATGAVHVDADRALLAQAIGNVVDNAILFNRAGGRVDVELRSYEHGARFALRVADNGPGVSDEEFAGLTANKRFRGDVSRTRRPGGRGLGLAVAREVADRFGLQLDIRQPSAGGMEVEFSPRPAR
jgi:signal transduction histidine kinase